ncbi:MAG: hypothetical protein ACPIOQ_66655, partial [Promethearchaeia archaeon]
RGRPYRTKDPRCSSHTLPLWQPLCKRRAQLKRELRRMVAMTQSIGTSMMLCIYVYDKRKRSNTRRGLPRSE